MAFRRRGSFDEQRRVCNVEDELATEVEGGQAAVVQGDDLQLRLTDRYVDVDSLYH